MRFSAFCGVLLSNNSFRCKDTTNLWYSIQYKQYSPFFAFRYIPICLCRYFLQIWIKKERQNSGSIEIWNFVCESVRANNGETVIRPTVGQKSYNRLIASFHDKIVPIVLSFFFTSTIPQSASLTKSRIYTPFFHRDCYYK